MTQVQVPVVIQAVRNIGQDLTFRLPHMTFSHDAFDHLLDLGRQLVQNLKQSFNLKEDLGEDILLIALTKVALQEFDDLNFELIHVVYRILDKEVEAGRLFDDIVLDY